MKHLTILLLLLTPFAALSDQEKPNILWFTSEDNGISWVGCYGSQNAKTPNIDRLAEEGFRYTYCFDNAAVCAPTRSTWITGMYAISMGTQPMRSRYDIPNDKIPYYPDLLRKMGYHTSNPGKTDYNIGSREDKDCWDYAERDEKYGWRMRKPGQPFFSVVNNGMSHEGSAHGEKIEGALAWTEVREHDVDPEQMKLYAYHPDLPVIRDSYARYANRIGVMDEQFGECIEALKEDGLYEDTIIIYNSDHGGVMPRSKRFLYSSGIHCPLVIRIPEKWKHLWPASRPGMTVDRLVSFVDMPKTWLSLVGAEIPSNFQGTIFIG